MRLKFHTKYLLFLLNLSTAVQICSSIQKQTSCHSQATKASMAYYSKDGFSEICPRSNANADLCNQNYSSVRITTLNKRQTSLHLV